MLIFKYQAGWIKVKKEHAFGATDKVQKPSNPNKEVNCYKHVTAHPK
jgi:hypothetical protein